MGHGCFAPYNVQWYKYRNWKYGAAHSEESASEPETQAH